MEVLPRLSRRSGQEGRFGQSVSSTVDVEFVGAVAWSINLSSVSDDHECQGF